MNGGDGTDTMSYLEMQNSISLEASGVVNKGLAGTDSITNMEHIIAPMRQENIIDASTGTGTASIDVDLSVHRLTVNGIPGLGSLNFQVDNFVNVTGTSNADSITGDRGNNYLVGGAGNDTLTGLGGRNTLVGVNSQSANPGSNETDTLVGGESRNRNRDRDLFVLGDSSSTFYQGAGNAIIKNFDLGSDRIQLRGSRSDYDISANSIKLAGSSDLIATIQGNFNANALVFV